MMKCVEKKEGKKEVWEPNESTMRWLKVEVRKSHPPQTGKNDPPKLEGNIVKSNHSTFL